MIAKRKPTGYIATCQCGEIVGAMHLLRTLPREHINIFELWIANGCNFTPRFDKTWSARVVACKCIQPTEDDP